MRNHYKPGVWNVVCDVCGFEFKSDQLKKRWDGAMVCDADFETRHPSDLLRVPREDVSVPWARPEPADTYTDVTYTEEVTAVDFVANTTSGTEPVTVTFTPTVTGDALTYSWTFVTGAIIQRSTQTSPVVVFNAGSTSVYLTVTGVSGSSASKTKLGYIYIDAGGGA